MTAALVPPSHGSRLKNFLRKKFAKIRDINRRYAHPRIHTSGWVAASLLLLRLYLFVLIGVLLFKFITLLHP